MDWAVTMAATSFQWHVAIMYAIIRDPHSNRYAAHSAEPKNGRAQGHSGFIFRTSPLSSSLFNSLHRTTPHHDYRRSWTWLLRSTSI